MCPSRLRVLIAALAITATSAACTARYSQSLVGRIPSSSGQEVSSSDAGLSIFAVVVNEPTSAAEQVGSLLGACNRLTKVQVDYREILFFIVGIPKISITATCEK